MKTDNPVMDNLLRLPNPFCNYGRSFHGMFKWISAENSTRRRSQRKLWIKIPYPGIFHPVP
jgi:hypothetical protein